MQLLDEKHKVSLIQKNFYGKDCLPSELESQENLTITNIACKSADKNSLIKRILLDVQYYIKAIGHIRRNKDYDVFFLQSNNIPWLPIAIIKKFTHKPIVYNIQDIFPQNAIFLGVLRNRTLITNVLLQLQKWALKNSDSIITISEDMKDTLVEIGAHSNKVYVIYNWKNEVRKKNKLSEQVNDGKRHVVYAGNIGKMQDVETIVYAAAALKSCTNIQFDIYGEGASKEKCIALAQKLQATNILFSASVPADQAYVLYENADLNIISLAPNIIKTALPSKTAICVESGKPAIFCIGTTSKLSDIVKRDNIFFIESKDSSALANTIQTCLENGQISYDIDTTTSKVFNKESSTRKYVDVIVKTGKRRK